MINNKVVSVVVVVAIIIGIVWYVSNKNKIIGSEVPPTGQTTQTQNNKKVPEPPGIPKFILGNVSKIEGQKVFIKVGTEEKTIITNKKTVLISQVKDGQGYKNVPATFSDIKISSQIVVYYSQNSGSQYTADKVQILNF